MTMNLRGFALALACGAIVILVGSCDQLLPMVGPVVAQAAIGAAGALVQQHAAAAGIPESDARAQDAQRLAQVVDTFASLFAADAAARREENKAFREAMLAALSSFSDSLRAMRPADAGAGDGG